MAKQKKTKTMTDYRQGGFSSPRTPPENPPDPKPKRRRREGTILYKKVL